MKKLFRTVSNNAIMLGYFIRFAPVYFFAQTLFCIFVSFVDIMSFSYTLQYVFNGLQNGMDFTALMKFLAFVGVLMLMRHIWGAWCEYLYADAMLKVTAGVRKMIFEQARCMDVEYYETPKFYQDFVWASSQADEKIRDIMQSWSQLIARVSDFIFIGGFMLVNDMLLFVFVLISAVVSTVTGALTAKKQYEMDAEAKVFERRRDYVSRVFYLADYAKEIKLSDMHKTLYERLKSAIESIVGIYRGGGIKCFKISMLDAAVSSVVMEFAMNAYLCYQVLVSRRMQYGDWAGLSNAAWGFSYTLGQFAMVFTQFAKHSMYIEHFRDFMAYRPEIENHKGMKCPNDIAPITLKNVSFRYDTEKHDSLKNIDFTINPYEKIAIVGYNGAGKSTLVKLLMRLYDVTEGEIMLGDTNIKKFDTHSYRSRFGAVFQDYKIFAVAVSENVLMDFVGEQDRERIEKALDESGFSEKLASLPEGIDTLLTREFDDKGAGLSGGEEQKLAIARVFAKNCNYVILDEPSSALDPVSEYKLNQTIMHLAENKSVIFISHRLSTTCMADKIYMLENGSIIESGSHTELMALGGKYAEMFNKQAEKYQI